MLCGFVITRKSEELMRIKLQDERAATFLDLLLSFVLIGFAVIAIFSQGQLLAVVAAGEGVFARKKGALTWNASELKKSCRSKSVKGGFTRKKCCKKEGECIVFLVQKDR